MVPALPVATYRLQLTKDFTFDDAAALVPYLKALGISHIYTSPFLKARPGSTHGYDIVDHGEINPELGGEQGFARLDTAIQRHDLGLILDFVPNHMGVGHDDNAWWLDVLEWGQKSPHAQAFDIDWDGLPHRRHPGVLLPILGRPYGEALQSGEIELKFDSENGSFAAMYFDHKLPIAPQRYSELIRTVVNAAGAAKLPAGRELLGLADEFRDPRAPTYAQAPELKRRLSQMIGAPAVIEHGLAAYRADSEAGAAALHRLLERQNYRLAYWRVAFSAVNYRRFFDISDLAAIRPEDPKTFRAMHALVARLIAAGQLQGLRLDHIDGLRDPAQYTRRLRRLVRKVGGRDLYIIVEKILADGEPMPNFPGVSGTTGYEWLNIICRVLADGNGLLPLERTWREFTGERASFGQILEAAKARVINTMLASEFNVLARALARIAAGHFSTRDFTLDRLRAALQRYVIEFPVYRTYVTANGASEHDRRIVEHTIESARARWRGPDPEIFDFLKDAITLVLAANPSYSTPRVRNFALKLQQFTGPLMAKAMEDTAFYRDHRLLAFNEVGGDPAASALALTAFYEQMARRAHDAPHGLTATATHDTKRGEDARARILALSELAAEWDSAVTTWREQNARLRDKVGSHEPSAAHEYMIYQALIGAWPEQIDPPFIERVQAYALKAARESKTETSWTNPNERYEAALAQFIGRLLDRMVSAAFLDSFSVFAARTALLGALNSLSQLALKCLLPGVPDFYQGTEFWDFSLVDPDNRRRVDFAARDDAMSAGPPDWAHLAGHWHDGRIKLALTRQLLKLRGENIALFGDGTFSPVSVAGSQAANVIAYRRKLGRAEIIVVAGRHFAPLTNGGRDWPARIDCTLQLDAKFHYQDALEARSAPLSGKIDVNDLLHGFPVGALCRL